jgi:hypothetical protein
MHDHMVLKPRTVPPTVRLVTIRRARLWRIEDDLARLAPGRSRKRRIDMNKLRLIRSSR